MGNSLSQFYFDLITPIYFPISARFTIFMPLFALQSLLEFSFNPMENLIQPEEKIKNQMIFWFLKYHHQTADEFIGTEQFCLFAKLLQPEQMKFLPYIEPPEIPVLILKLEPENFIINTTRRFMLITPTGFDTVNYTEFDGHQGYKSFGITLPGKQVATIKTDGYQAEFGIRRTDGWVVYWSIPTGHVGFSFWNITKKFNLIGKKYLTHPPTIRITNFTS
jgi:hypothetical protein